MAADVTLKTMVTAFASACGQALVLSHEAASKQEMQPYLSEKLWPLRPLVLFGRSASRQPPCHKEECVWYAWRDHASTRKQTRARVHARVRAPLRAARSAVALQ